VLKKPSRNAKEDAKRVSDQVEALTTLVKICLKQIRDLTAREAVLRSLVNYGQPVSEQKYGEMYAEALHSFDAHVQQVVKEANEIHKNAMLLQLLETHDSKPQ